MIDDWLNYCWRFANEPSGLYASSRKITRNVSMSFKLNANLSLADVGYTRIKMAMLRRYYFNEESIAVAQKLWQLRLSQARYGSVSFTTFNHYVKGRGDVEDIIENRGIGSVFGPCIQSVVITWVDKRTRAIDVFYRTTELFKKFPADLVFLRETLALFPDVGDVINVHFANVTLHPMYFVVPLTHLVDPAQQLKQLQHSDPYFFKWTAKWTAKYLVNPRGIEKFSQAMKVRKWALEVFDQRNLRKLQTMLKGHQSGDVSELSDGD